MNKLLFSAGLLLLLPAAAAFAGRSAPTQYDSYDGTAVDARALGMGLAYVAVQGDASIHVHNPASLADVTANSFVATYETSRNIRGGTDPYGDEPVRTPGFRFLCLAVPGSALSWRPLSAESVTAAAPGLTRTSDIRISAFTLASAKNYAPGLTTGFNLAYLDGRIGDARVENGVPSVRITDGHGVSLDLAARLTAGRSVTLGLVLHNVLGFMWWNDFEKDILPFGVRAGVAYHLSPQTLLSAEWLRRYYRKDGRGAEQTVHAGLEQAIGPVKVRAGIFGEDIADKDTAHITAGLGYAAGVFTVSVASERYRVDSEDIDRYIASVTAPF